MRRANWLILPLFVLTIGLGLFAVWRLLAFDPPAEPVVAVAEAGESAPRAEAPRAEGDLTAPQDPAAAERRGAQTPATAVRPEAGRDESFALEGARWIEGRVAAPHGAPLDETLAVWAFGSGNPSQGPGAHAAISFGDDGLHKRVEREVRRGADARWARRTVAADGRFRVPAASDTPHVELWVDGRYLYLEEPRAIDGAPEGALVLEPELGAWLTGVVRPPPAAGAGDHPRGAAVHVGGFRMGGRGGGMLQRRTEVAEDLTFELRGLPAFGQVFLGVVPERLAPATVRDVRLDAGRRTELVVDLVRGARVLGRVVDEERNGVAGAKVSSGAGRGGMGMMFLGGGVGARETRSAEDGTFELLGIAPGKGRVSVELKGYVDGESDPLELVDGGLVQGLEIALTRGHAVAGRVTWPDGKPAGGAQVSVQEPREREGRRGGFVFGGDRTQLGTADAEGAFRITGLGAGPYVVGASKRLPGGEGEAAEAAAELQPERSVEVFGESVEIDDVGEVEALIERATAARGARGERGPVWTASEPNVAADRADVVLVLSEPPGLAGRVVDAAGKPVPRYRVSASRSWRSGTRSALGPNDLDTNVDDPEGRFALPGLTPGRWSLDVHAEGYVQQGEDESAEFDVPHAGPEIVIVVVRAGTVSGTVVDPLGQPVAEADVRLASGGEQNPFFFGGGEEVESDEKGAFTLADARPGRYRLTAAHESWARSKPIDVEVVAGQAVEGLVVTLGRGGHLTGEVWEGPGRRASGGQVQMFSMTAGDARQIDVQSDGTFQAENLTPGTYQVMLQPDVGDFLGGDEEAEVNPAEMLSKLKMTSCEIREGETTHVVLGAPPEKPVRVHGLVKSGGRPVSGGFVALVNEGGALLSSLKFGGVDSEGRYEVTLDRPGPVVFTYAREMGSQNGIEFYVDVPEASEHRCDLELPVNGIRGRVIGVDGRPAADVQVEIEREGAPTLSGLGGSTSATTAADGGFAFEVLTPGRYTVAAGGRGSGFAAMVGGGEAPATGRATRSGIEVTADAVVSGVELVLSAPGKITGTVRGPDGQPAAGANVWVRDAAGTIVHRMSSVASGADGRFAYEGLAPGTYTVAARTASQASPEGRAVKVGSGAATEVDLLLEPGTILRVSLVDEEDRPLRASLSIVDEDGRDQSGQTSFESVARMMTEGISSSERRFGPLAAGKYVVHARTPDGREARKPVTLKGQDERSIKLRLD